MKMKIKVLIAALSLSAVATGANANIAIGDDAPGEIFMTVFDPSAQTSYSLDLGISIREMVDTLSTPRSFDLTSDANFATFIGQTDLRYTVTGRDAAFTDLETYGVMTTATIDAATLQSTNPNDNFLNQRSATIRNFGLNSSSAAGDVRDDSLNLSSFSVLGELGYYDIPTWGDTLGSGSGFVAASDVDSAINFYQIGLDTTTFFDTVVAKLGTWKLSSDGSLAYAPAVPVPAAVWLFGSGLLGMIGVARRKKK